jgi:hypothetical protein
MVTASSIEIKHFAQFTDEEIKEKVNRISAGHFRSGNKKFRAYPF